MKRLFWAAAIYTILGLAGGLYFRELTKAHDFTGHTELAVVHTHLLTLGTIVLLLILALDRALHLSDQRRLFAAFFWIYNIGLVLTATMMTIIGTRTVQGLTNGPALAGPAGIGHILLTIAFILLLVIIGRSVHAQPARSTVGTQNRPASVSDVAGSPATESAA
ncbi:DUF2871 domain-containing protein [Microlunatus elymi]|uniref:DUF2871 domain-containing protein n=1 Tax=Microlunatus elymi TaxID=2596828 RepID=A0A516PW48_9ACTN|nr:DUF2871 domain-containing protein [Microlunatus elymi]QDP95403.1 DUF2871 domain-containing protein [Microlunatus elymi]